MTLAGFEPSPNQDLPEGSRHVSQDIEGKTTTKIVLKQASLPNNRTCQYLSACGFYCLPRYQGISITDGVRKTSLSQNPVDIIEKTTVFVVAMFKSCAIGCLQKVNKWRKRKGW